MALQSRSGRLDADGPRSLVPGLGLVGDLRALGKRAIALAEDRRLVYEQIRGLVVGRDEPEALVVAEPLDGSGRHLRFLLPFGVPRTRRLLAGRTATASIPVVGRSVQPGWYPLAATGAGRLLARTIERTSS